MTMRIIIIIIIIITIIIIIIIIILTILHRCDDGVVYRSAAPPVSWRPPASAPRLSWKLTHSHRFYCRFDNPRFKHSHNNFRNGPNAHRMLRCFPET